MKHEAQMELISGRGGFPSPATYSADFLTSQHTTLPLANQELYA